MTPAGLAAMYAVRDRREWWRVSQIGSLVISAMTGKHIFPITYSPFVHERPQPEPDPEELGKGLLEWATAHNARNKRKTKKKRK